MSEVELNLGGGRVRMQVGDGEPEVIDYEYGFEDDDEYEPDSLEEALQDCGRGQDYDGCTLAGTEYCEFECPFRD